MAKINKGKIEFENEASQAKFGYVKGEAKWAQVLEIDQFGNFSIDMYGDDVVELEDELVAMRDSAYEEVIEAGKKAEKADVLREDDDGRSLLKFKLPELNYKGEANNIVMYNDNGKKVDDWSELVGNGSIVKIKYRAAPYYMASTKKVGVSLKFYAVQVINLVEYVGQDEGFGDESDGKAPFDVDTPAGEDF